MDFIKKKTTTAKTKTDSIFSLSKYINLTLNNRLFKKKRRNKKHKENKNN